MMSSKINGTQLPAKNFGKQYRNLYNLTYDFNDKLESPPLSKYNYIFIYI